MAQKISPKGTGIALALITFILSIVCLLIVLLLGDLSVKLFNQFFHGIDLSSLKTTPNILQGLIGSVILAVGGFISGWLFAVIYNRYSN